MAQLQIVFGMPCGVSDMPMKDWPPGRIRMRFRNTGYATAFVQTPEGIRRFYVGVKDGFLVPCYEIAANQTREA